MKKFVFFVLFLVFCFSSLAFLAKTGTGREGFLKSYAAYLMQK
ncbi:MAG: hypothetical protein WCS92_01195 [Candidatus Babeliales bacterium]